MSDYNTAVIEEFRANDGRVGGHWEGRDLLLLTTTGRKSGRKHTTPMVYTRDGDRLLVYASKAGAPEHPDWYLNLVASSRVTVEVGAARYEATAVPLEGEERDRRFAEHAERFPAFAEYQREDRPRDPGRRARARPSGGARRTRTRGSRLRTAPRPPARASSSMAGDELGPRSPGGRSRPRSGSRPAPFPTASSTSGPSAWWAIAT